MFSPVYIWRPNYYHLTISDWFGNYHRYTDPTEHESRIQNTINTISNQGGGTVYILSGNYYNMSVTIKQNVSLEIESGVTNFNYTKDTGHSEAIFDKRGALSIDKINNTKRLVSPSQSDFENTVNNYDNVIVEGNLTLSSLAKFTNVDNKWIWIERVTTANDIKLLEFRECTKNRIEIGELVCNNTKVGLDLHASHKNKVFIKRVNNVPTGTFNEDDGSGSGSQTYERCGVRIKGIEGVHTASKNDVTIIDAYGSNTAGDYGVVVLMTSTTATSNERANANSVKVHQFIGYTTGVIIENGSVNDISIQEGSHCTTVLKIGSNAWDNVILGSGYMEQNGTAIDNDQEFLILGQINFSGNATDISDTDKYAQLSSENSEGCKLTLGKFNIRYHKGTTYQIESKPTDTWLIQSSITDVTGIKIDIQNMVASTSDVDTWVLGDFGASPTNIVWLRKLTGGSFNFGLGNKYATPFLPTREADPGTTELPEGNTMIYVSDGSADCTGDDGDVIVAVNSGGTIKTKILADFDTL